MSSPRPGTRLQTGRSREDELSLASRLVEEGNRLTDLKHKLEQVLRTKQGTTAFRASLHSFQNSTLQRNVATHHPTESRDNRPFFTERFADGRPADNIAGWEWAFEKKPLPADLTELKRLPPLPHYDHALQIADRLTSEVADVLRDSPDQLAEVTGQIEEVRTAAVAGKHGFGALSRFEDLNCAVAFPGSFFLNDLRGTKCFTSGGPSEFFSLEVRPINTSLTRQKTYDAFCELRLPKKPGKPIQGVVYEYSPIRWNGHYGYESCFMTQRDGFRWLNEYRDVFVGDKVYSLSHTTCLFAQMSDVHAMRRPTRERARLFYQSFRWLKPPDVDAKPQQQSLQGRWVVKSGPSSRKANKSVGPKELAFLGTALYGGPSGRWGHPRGDGPLPHGIFHMARFVEDASSGVIELDVIGPRTVIMQYHYKIDNDRLLVSQSPFDIRPDADLPEHVDVFVRPGDGVPLL